MSPTAFDLLLIEWFAPLQARPLWVDLGDTLVANPLVNGLVYALPLTAYWLSGSREQRDNRQALLFRIMLASAVGIALSLLLRQFFAWPPPANHPELRRLFVLHDPPNPNRNSFPSDSAILYSTVAFGLAPWNRRLAAGLLAWLALVIAPLRIFVGGHYPSDILAGGIIGYVALQLAAQLLRRLPPLSHLARGGTAAVRFTLLLWIFELGNEFQDVLHLFRLIAHISAHHL